MPRSVLLIVCVTLLAVGLANIDGPLIRVYPERVLPPKTKVIEHERVVTRTIPGKRPDGFITEDECHQIANGADFPDVVYRYGWPAGEDGDDSYAGYLTYPLREGGNRVCNVSFFDGEVEDVRLDL